MSINDFEDKHGVEYQYQEDGYFLPCYATRFSVTKTMNTDKDIQLAIRHARESCNTSLVMFSVTERDVGAWKAWKQYSIKHPKTFSVVEGNSGHGPYKCRMYFYKRPAKRK